ncbi:MAG: L,D-transpeptidase family protein [Bdellovibrionaceae bacterium]|nr:L,D-transpeptidase family protein [Pseudobdellovibrionaceae bacterium]MBX3033107.1 L,D-transpeptidase family protein [Pseudobdellovibrionaceae bacterium]
MRTPTLLSLLITGSLAAYAETATTVPVESAVNVFPADLLQISTTQAFSKHVMLVDKSARKLMIFERDGETIRKIDEIPADIGKNNGNKEKENDHRTPEGIYFFQQKKAPPEIPFSLYGKMAFTTDYPNLFDKRAKKTGSGIWLHSIPENVPLTRGSRGCIVIRNEALARVESYIQLHETPVIIYDKIEYIAKEEHDRRRKELGEWMENWRQSWESQDADRYLSFYDKDFSAPGFKGFSNWEKHKRRLARNYKTIKVTLNQPFLLLHKDQLIIKTLQKYESDRHADYGVKVVHALRTKDGYKIIREEWEKADETGTTSPAQISALPPVSSEPQKD